jgi:hypothetical protein
MELRVSKGIGSRVARNGGCRSGNTFVRFFDGGYWIGRMHCGRCDSRITWEAITKEFLKVDEVRPHLTEYFTPLEDEIVQFQIIQSLRDRLDTIEGV